MVYSFRWTMNVYNIDIKTTQISNCHRQNALVSPQWKVYENRIRCPFVHGHSFLSRADSIGYFPNGFERCRRFKSDRGVLAVKHRRGPGGWVFQQMAVSFPILLSWMSSLRPDLFVEDMQPWFWNQHGLSWSDASVAFEPCIRVV